MRGFGKSFIEVKDTKFISSLSLKCSSCLIAAKLPNRFGVISFLSSSLMLLTHIISGITSDYFEAFQYKNVGNFQILLYLQAATHMLIFTGFIVYPLLSLHPEKYLLYDEQKYH